MCLVGLVFWFCLVVWCCLCGVLLVLVGLLGFFVVGGVGCLLLCVGVVLWVLGWFVLLLLLVVVMVFVFGNCRRMVSATGVGLLVLGVVVVVLFVGLCGFVVVAKPSAIKSVPLFSPIRQ